MISTLWVILVFCLFHKQIGVGRVVRHYETPEEWQDATLKVAVWGILLLASTGAVQWYFGE
ncbi:hypothetical protein ASE92_08320 [Pedobacter sp. Leaf41]|nr:hypothetical protein ASE92_08320 [Pedobacter sp. Leaf41]